MKLSILIPEYNQSCIHLVQNLQQQCLQEAVEYEVIVADDGSSSENARIMNRDINKIPGCTFHECTHNMGRSRVRNLLTQLSTGDYLLFVDSDAKVECPTFIHSYVKLLPTQSVICGGIHHEDILADDRCILRWRYEKWSEPHFTAERRSLRPYQNLRTFNFLMPRAVALRHPFDEAITQYGYEDTLLGKELERDHVNILHIDNPLTNADLEADEEFLRKTEESLRTLKALAGKMEGSSSLLAHYNKLKRCHLLPLYRLFYRLFRSRMRRNILTRHPSMVVFQLYKLGYFCCL